MLAGKCAWHEQAAQAVLRKDLALAARLAEALPGTIAATEALMGEARVIYEYRLDGRTLTVMRTSGMRSRQKEIEFFTLRLTTSSRSPPRARSPCGTRRR